MLKDVKPEINFISHGWLIQPESLAISHPEKGRFSVQSKVMQVLIALIKADNQLVDKQTLLNKVWHNTTITDNSLNQAISELRKIFADSRKNPQFIETVPTKGYRFIASVKPTSQTTVSPKIPVNTNSTNYLKPAVIFGIVSLLTLAILLFMISQLSLDQINSENQKLKLTVAPNGQAVAFFIRQEQGAYLHVQKTDHSSAPVTTFIKKPQSLALAWSNDSQKIVYNATQKEQPFYAINVLELNTGQTRYYKAAKNDSRHQQDSLPPNFNKPVENAEHQEFMLEGNKIDKVKFDEDEFFSAYFDQGKISSFSWQTVTSAD